MKLQISRSIATAVLFGVTFVGGAAVQAQTLLKVDVSDRTPQDGSATHSNTQPDYSLYLMGAAGGTAGVTSTVGVTQTVGSYSMTLAPVTNSYVNTSTGATVSGSGTMDDRDRNFSLPAGSTTTLTEIYDDFVLNTSNTGGLKLTLSGGSLLPGTQYAIALYAYDYATNTSLPRTAQWVDDNNAGATVLTTSFSGGDPARPTTDDAYRFTGVAVTDASGVLSLRGVNTSNLVNGVPSTFGVLINGLEITVVPEPTTAVSVMAVAALGAARRRRA